jgi:hypothetical protein
MAERFGLIAMLALVGAGAAACGSQTEAVTVTVIRTATTPSTTRSQVGGRLVRFRLPSGNIVCAIGDVVRCRVLSAGNTDYILFSNGKATERQSAGGAVVPARVLRYGSRFRRGSFTCISSERGLFCHAQGHGRGLFLSREQQSLDARPPGPIIRNTSPPGPPPRATVADKDFAVQSLQIKDDGLGDIGGIARLTNTSSDTLTATFTFTFFQGGQIVGTAVGSANEVAPGQTVTVDLSSQDRMISGRFHYEFQVDAQF